MEPVGTHLGCPRPHNLCSPRMGAVRMREAGGPLGWGAGSCWFARGGAVVCPPVPVLAPRWGSAVLGVRPSSPLAGQLEV